MKYISTRHETPGSPASKTFKGAGANVKQSRLNAKGDKYWRGARGGEKMSKSGGYSKKMGY